MNGHHSFTTLLDATQLLNSPPPPSCYPAVAAAASTDTLHQQFASIDHD
jgi:hypothetical protein